MALFMQGLNRHEARTGVVAVEDLLHAPAPRGQINRSRLRQAGAIDLARRGWTVDQILSRYYPGAQLVPIQSLGGANGGAL